ASHFGGTRQGLAISWPGHIKDVGGIRSEFHHVIDIVPTILEATGIKAPETVNGITQRPIEGVSMAYTFADAKAPSTRTTQYFEMAGNRGIYNDGWMANTTPFAPPWDLATGKLPDVVNGYKWELYHITEDFTQNNDLTISAEITVPEGGAEGMIVTLGGRFGGYGFFLQKGKPVFVYNLLDLERFRWEGGIGGKIGEDFFGRALPPGEHTLVFDFKY